MLEKILYQPRVQQEQSQRVYQVVDLKGLSAIALYSSGPIGGGGSGPVGGSGPLTIRDFPSSGFQLHIHEGAGGSAHIWDYKRRYRIPISSYDAAMADLSADNLNMTKMLVGILKKFHQDD